MTFLILPLGARAESALDFFEEEARVVSASRAPVRVDQAPATVHVLTGEEIRLSGAHNLWDALRMVPGVDVMTTAGGQGEVSIRGLNGTLSNRTLVLLDGRSVLNDYFGFMIWEQLPVPLDEIDRIEVVEGPASALYGANAVTGVIQIITKTPDQLKGGVATYAGGEHRSHQAGAVYGSRAGATSAKASAGWRSTYLFSNKDTPASKTPRAHAWLGRDLAGGGKASLSAGGTQVDTVIPTGFYGTATPDGPTGFVKADVEKAGWRARAYWNYSRITARDYSFLGSPNLDNDSFDAQAEKTLLLGGHTLTAGGWYRRNTMKSRMFQPGLLSQDLWAVFAEDAWRWTDRWSATAGARLDRHPFTDLIFSPRGAVLWSPAVNQTVRFSAASSFRNPTLLENYVQLPILAPNPGDPPLTNPPFTALNILLTGNRELKPERMMEFEVSHHGRWKRVTTTATAFHYKLSHVIGATDPAPVGTPTPPVADLAATFANQSNTRAWGGELGAEAPATRGVSAFASAAYLSLKDNLSSSARSQDAPKWKLNGGLRARAGRWSSGATAHWVGKTRVEAYTLLDLYAGVRLGGERSGAELFVSGFNVGGKKHFEGSPALFAEEIGSRWMGGTTVRF